ncbi:alpha-tocopherol transfer protein-like [Ptychodera flava]|uniref:alpha-tocopherol transfer protein-like n=1 Tax=Ptychodera flava TaxID=63121 RepID=UPI00396A152D
MAEVSALPYKCTLSETSLEKAKRELNEDPATRQQKLNELRDLFKNRPDINFRLDDAFLLRFLRNKKFDVDRTLKALIHYYKVRRDYREIFDNYKPSAVRDTLNFQHDFICPSRDKEGRVVFVTRIGLMDEYDVTEVVKAQLLLLETLLCDEEVQVNGMVYAVDWAKLSSKDMKYTSPMMLKKVTDVYLIHFHGDEYGSLHEHVPSAMLPCELGGQLPGYDNTEWVNKILAAEEDFVYYNQFGFLKSADVLGKQETTADPTTGLTGTFKKLDVN